MFRLAIILLIIALIAGVLGFGGVMGVAVDVAWILAVIGLLLLVINAIAGRRAV